MSGENVRIYPSVTPEKFAQLLAEVKAAGAEVEGNAITLKGVRIDFTFGGTSLALLITRKPFFMSYDKIFSLVEQKAGLSA